ncbi:MAG: chemotaxis protein CheW [Magnetococcus sp. YQC-5]
MVSIKEKRDCLIFEITGKLYGVESLLVQELVRLPEIVPMEDAPAFIVGVINLRGRVVPVVDLNIRMGRLSTADYALTDAIVILEWQGMPMGIIINDVREVRELLPGAIEEVPHFEEHDAKRYRFVTAVAKVGEEMVMLLNPEHLLHAFPVDTKTLPSDGHEFDHEILTAQRIFNPGATPEERLVLHARAQRLMNSLEMGEADGMIPLTVVQLHGECFGVDLTRVQGFAQLRQVTPIPCCPDHITGCMNLRGDILTLVDLTRILHLPVDSKVKPGKVMVARVDHLTVGILVHDVVDVIHRRPDAIVRVPVSASGLKKEHLLGTVSYESLHGEIMLGILNLEAILHSKELLVHETV